ncbi:receptor-type tyrosine-protein phosphatase C-like isoform X2 [Eleginops maclovinus]|uniref:receptor-type tyrosine-protein phosphatase C-like isoform X2 n=1 Tax=Eleginops maclovinus TaxID=56733 RepID=UPI00307FD382
MAGLSGLKILLLWTGILIMAKYSTQAPQPLKCSYTVKPIQFGFQIDMTKNFTTGNYTININEKGRPDTRHKYSIQFSESNSAHAIKHLKPCTDYEHNVAFIDGAGKETPRYCTNQINTTRTLGMNQGDIKGKKCMPGYVCYNSEWDISSSLSTPNNISAVTCKRDEKEICFKPRYNDICTDLTTTFTSGNCAKNINLHTSITADFLNPSEISKTIPTKLPAEIKTNLPPNCKHLNITYTCLEDGKPNELNLTDLEPYTNYNCTGQIMHNNVIINKTTAIQFRIDCDLTISILELSVTNNSIHLSWNTHSEKCGDVLSNLPKLSYECSCQPRSEEYRMNQTINAGNTGGSCTISRLEPYTKYECAVQPKYNKSNVAGVNKKTTRTKIGVPGRIQDLMLDLTQHNVIKATCKAPHTLNGPVESIRYIARLYIGGVLKYTLNETKCKFEFKDLSYSTNYSVEVTASYGGDESDIIEGSTSISFDNALIVRLVFFILTSLAFALVLYKIYTLRLRKSRNFFLLSDENVDENEAIELTEIYENVSGPECRYRDTT